MFDLILYSLIQLRVTCLNLLSPFCILLKVCLLTVTRRPITSTNSCNGEERNFLLKETRGKNENKIKTKMIT